MLKRILLGAAATSLALGGVAHAAEEQAPARTAAKTEAEEMAGPSAAIFVLAGVVAGLAILEITEAINIFDDEDEPASP